MADAKRRGALGSATFAALTGGLVFLAVSVAAWWHVWSGGVAHSVTTQGWGDPAQEIWFVAWVPHALGAGIDPFVSHAIFAPAGINLMANTSILFPALVVSPVTVLFGPLVGFNVLVTLAPALSAFVAWRVACRYTTFELGAWLAGLFYGFSPFVLNDLADGHIHVTLLAFPPLFLALLDDIVVSRRGSPVGRGVLLGLVAAAQALTSLEVLAIVSGMSLAGLVLLGLWYHRRVRERLGRIAAGLGAAIVTAAVLLAWPAWLLIRGPRRYHGSVFTSPESYVVWLKALVWPSGGLPPHYWPSYVGIPLLVLVVLGAWRVRSTLLRLSVALVVVALVFAMGRTLHVTPDLSTGIPLPDRLVSKLALFDNILPVRFMVVVDLCVALGLAVTLGAVRDGVNSVIGGHGAHRERRNRTSALGSIVAAGLGVVALASPAIGVRWPYPARQVSVPAVYRSRAITHLAPGSVLLAYPVMNGFRADPMIWQAEEDMTYDMVAGYGFIPSNGPHPYGSLPASPVTDLFGDAQIGALSTRVPPSRIKAVRREIDGWKVSDVVVLDEGGAVRDLVGVLTTVLGRRPQRLDGAYVWLGLRPPALGGG